MNFVGTRRAVREPPGANWLPFAMGPFLFRRRVKVTLQPLTRSVTAGTPDFDLSCFVRSIGECAFDIFPEAGFLLFVAMAVSPHRTKSLYPEQLAREWTLEGLVEDACAQGSYENAIARVWNCMVREFRWAMESGACEVHAHVGHEGAFEFKQIAPLALYSCSVVHWGHPLVGGSEITLADGTTLYDVHVCEASKEQVKPARRGRRPKVDWDGCVKPFVYEQLEYHGYPHSGDPEWGSQADVERDVLHLIENKFGTTVSESTVRSHTRKYMREWLATKGL